MWLASICKILLPWIIQYKLLTYERHNPHFSFTKKCWFFSTVEFQQLSTKKDFSWNFLMKRSQLSDPSEKFIELQSTCKSNTDDIFGYIMKTYLARVGYLETFQTKYLAAGSWTTSCVGCHTEYSLSTGPPSLSIYQATNLSSA